MLYSRATQHAIRALTHLVTIPAGTYVAVRDVANATRVPLPYLAKIMQSLARGGLVASRKGPGGGVALRRGAARITLAQIVDAVDGNGVFTGCLLGLQRCSDASPCAVHEVWKTLRETLRQELHELTLAEIAPAQRPDSRRTRGRAPRSNS
ncbi:MAG: RrF2 family transcriptional regulator [bacterium]